MINGLVLKNESEDVDPYDQFVTSDKDGLNGPGKENNKDQHAESSDSQAKELNEEIQKMDENMNMQEVDESQSEGNKKPAKKQNAKSDEEDDIEVSSLELSSVEDEADYYNDESIASWTFKRLPTGRSGEKVPEESLKYPL